MHLGGVIHLNKTGISLVAGCLVILFLYAISGSSKTDEASERTNLKRLLAVALKTAENGGLEVLAVKDNIDVKSKGLTKEGMQDSVTTADFLSHCAMMATLKHAFPKLRVISEEAKTECDASQTVDFADEMAVLNRNLSDFYVDTKDITVWIDPLDATHEYTEKLYKFVTTMVCVAVKGVPVMGVIHRPFSKETSWTWVGKGRSSDLKPKSVQQDEPKKPRIIISRSHSGPITDVLNRHLKNYELVIAAGAGYKALEVAHRKVDAYLHVTAIKKWDICAGNAVINDLGGKMTTKFDEVVDYTDLTNVVNERGLVATLQHHDLFIRNL